MKKVRMIVDGKEIHVEAIKEKLSEVQKRSTARTIDTQKLLKVLHCVEQTLGIPKKALSGVKIEYTGAQHFPNAYKYIPESTHFTAVHNGKCWEVTDIFRSLCPNRASNVEIRLTEEAKTAIIESMEAMRV